MTRALVVVDVQNDFCEGGALAVDGGRYVAVQVAEMLVGERPDYAAVVATRDAHEDPGSHSDDPDYIDSWPRHCVLGTAGAQLRPELAEVAWDAVFDKGRHEAAYSGFEGTSGGVGLADWLRGKGIDEVDVCGIATDYCVRATALDAVEAGFATRLLVDLTAAVHPDRVDEVLTELEAAGVAAEHADTD